MILPSFKACGKEPVTKHRVTSCKRRGQKVNEKLVQFCNTASGHRRAGVREGVSKNDFGGGLEVGRRFIARDSDAAKQPRKGVKESETSPRTEEELAWRKPVTKAATLAVLTSQCGGLLDPLWPPRFESWVIPLLVCCVHVEFSCILRGFVVSLKVLSNGRK